VLWIVGDRDGNAHARALRENGTGLKTRHYKCEEYRQEIAKGAQAGVPVLQRREEHSQEWLCYRTAKADRREWLCYLEA
jgi:hypothetical protein